jgi:pyruvate decarboxylase
MSDTKQIDSGKIPLGAYIFRRLQSIGINHVFGCPGDFNLNLLDHLYTVPGMQWVGNCNELNGAYAADGYARSRGVPGALITTYGVGELSALNGIAGAYSEHVPIIHIVGTTSRLAQKARLMIHHTLGDEAWDHTTLQQIPRILGAESVFLTDDSTFTVDIDRLIEACVKTRHPAYLFVPMDTPDILVDSTKLNTPLDLDISLPGLSNTENEIVDRIIGQLKQAAQPCVLVDVLAHRYGLVEEIREILRCTGLPVGSVLQLHSDFLHTLPRTRRF